MTAARATAWAHSAPLPAPAVTAAAPVSTLAIQPTGRPLLRFITCGSVDDGKSTLIGRLLYEANAIFDDQMVALERDSKRFGTTGGDLDFALLVDGLSAEREQGITIDVAYRYFSSAKRPYIVADTPGHEQYTRNMATGASTADVAILLVDARKGLLPQTRRHAFIVSMVGVKTVIVAINKMDLIGYDAATFARIKADFAAATVGLGFETVHVVPVAARHGDNVATRSTTMPWYDGPSILDILDDIETTPRAADGALRFPVQWVNRPHLDFRGFSGWVAGGQVAVGDSVTVLPGGQSSTVTRIVTMDGDWDVAQTGQSVTLTLADEIDVSRGDVLVGPGAGAKARTSIDAEVLWMHANGLERGQRLLVKVGAKTVAGTVEAIHDRVNMETYERLTAKGLALNEIGRVTIALETPAVVAPYATDRELGAFILIDPIGNDTLALGTVEQASMPGAGLTSRPAPAAPMARPASPTVAAPSRWARVGERGLEALILGAVAAALSGNLGVGAAITAVAFGLRPLMARLTTLITQARTPKGFEGDGI